MIWTPYILLRSFNWNRSWLDLHPSICSAGKNLFGYSSHLKAQKTGSENVKETVTVATTCFECQSVNGVCLCVCVGSVPSLIKGSNFTPHPINLYMLVGLFIAVSVTTQQHCCLLTEGAPVSCTFPLSWRLKIIRQRSKYSLVVPLIFFLLQQRLN